MTAEPACSRGARSPCAATSSPSQRRSSAISAARCRAPISWRRCSSISCSSTTRRQRRRDRFLLSKGHAVHVFHACLAELGPDRRRGAAAHRAASAAASAAIRRTSAPASSSPPARSATRSRSASASRWPSSSTVRRRARSCCSATASCRKARSGRRRCARRASASPNLLAIVDYNRFQSAGAVDDVAAARAAGRQVARLPLERARDRRPRYGGDRRRAATRPRLPKGPTVLIAHTVKGKGVPGIEGTARAHYTS